MRFIQQMLVALSVGLFAAAVGATPANPVSGTDYRTLDNPQQTDAGKKIEVIEFFWYACPHCNALDPSLSAWVKKQGDKIAFKRVPIAFRESFVPQQKLYYTLEAMGKLEELHSKIFHAIHGARQSLDTESTIIAFIEKQGIDKKKFADLYNSFGVQTKAGRATQLQQAYRIDGVPTIAIDGRFVTAPSIVGAQLGQQPESILHEATLQVMDGLVAKAAKGHAADTKSNK